MTLLTYGKVLAGELLPKPNTTGTPGTGGDGGGYGGIAGAQAIIADLVRRIGDIEAARKLWVTGDRITSTIAMTGDTMLIASDKIAILGEITFADWHRDVSGEIIGGLDPAVTQIRGGVIRTGRIENLDATAFLNLDATGDAVFLQSSTGVAFKASGKFTLGTAAGKQITYDGTTLNVDAVINTSQWIMAAASSLNSSGGIYASIIGRDTSGYTGVYGESTYAGGKGVLGYAGGSSASSYGVQGIASGGGNSKGVYGLATDAGSFGVVAYNAYGVALSVPVGTITVGNTTKVANLNADTVDGVDIGGIGLGATTVTQNLTTKPGATAGDNSWLAIVKAGVTYYLPVWTA